jgi:hypothetical protein
MFKLIKQNVFRNILGCQINQDGTTQTNHQDNGGNQVKASLQISSFPLHIPPVFIKSLLNAELPGLITPGVISADETCNAWPMKDQVLGDKEKAKRLYEMGLSANARDKQDIFARIRELEEME